MVEGNNKSKKTWVYILFTVLALGIMFGLCLLMLSRVGDAYKLTVKGLVADNPADAQAQCRADNEYFAGLQKQFSGNCWVWTGDNVVYLVRSSKLTVVIDDNNSTGFTKVRFIDHNGISLSGYIIDPVSESSVLGKILLDEEQELDFDKISMSVRVSMRNGDVDFGEAVYLWETGTRNVYAVKPEAVTITDGVIASFTDDGGNVILGYILDTDLG